MEPKQFKKMFGAIASENGFQSQYGGWFKESSECLLILTLQKSTYSNLYYLNIKVYINGMLQDKYVNSKDLTQNFPGNIFRRQPPGFDDVFDLEVPMTDEERVKEINSFFNDFVMPFAQKALSKEGIIELWKENLIFLTPFDKSFLEIKT